MKTPNKAHREFARIQWFAFASLVIPSVLPSGDCRTLERVVGSLQTMTETAIESSGR